MARSESLEIDVDDLIGVPFLYGGRTLDGLDCYGLLRTIQKCRGIELPDKPSPEAMEFQAAMAENITSHWADKLNGPEAYAMVIFNSRRFGYHCGTVLPDCRSFIHTATFTKKARIDRLDEWPWSRWLVGYFRCKNSDEKCQV